MTIQNALVVDDSKLARITLKRLLEKHQLSVSVAGSAEEALDIINRTLPDVVFMDHMMPNMDGFEATQKIKANPATAHIPVIMCTGKEGIPDYDDQARAIGASGTLAKPPQAEVLDGLLKQLNRELSQARPAAQTAEPTEPATQPSAEADLATTGTADITDVPAQAPAPQPSVTAPVVDLQPILARLDAMEGRVSGLADELEKLRQTMPQPVVVDEEALAARATRDAERTLMPLLESELNALSARVQTSLDEAISESRADLEAQIDALQHAIPSASAATAPAPVADEAALTDKVLTVAQDTVEAMLAHKLAQLEQQAEERVEQALAAFRAEQAQMAGAGSQAVTAAGPDMAALKTEVQSWVAAQLKTEAENMAEQLAERLSRELAQHSQHADASPESAPMAESEDNEWVRELKADNQRLHQALSSLRLQSWTLGLIAVATAGVALAKLTGLLP